MSGLDQLFQQFLRERTCVHNVTTKTRDWYQSAWHAFKQSQPLTPTEITKADLLAFVVHLRERGVKPVSCNTWLRAMNALRAVSRCSEREWHLTGAVHIRRHLELDRKALRL